MKTTTDYRSSQYPSFSGSRADGPDAETVNGLFSEVRSAFLQSQSLGGPTRKSMVSLVDTLLDCLHPDWDGYSALPVRPETYQNARRFLECLGGVSPQPSISPEPDGEISFEWYRAPRLRFSVSIGPDATLSYAGMFGTSSVHGTETFLDEVPVGILNQLDRLYRLPV